MEKKKYPIELFPIFHEDEMLEKGCEEDMMTKQKMKCVDCGEEKTVYGGRCSDCWKIVKRCPVCEYPTDACICKLPLQSKEKEI